MFARQKENVEGNLTRETHVIHTAYSVLLQIDKQKAYK